MRYLPASSVRALIFLVLSIAGSPIAAQAPPPGRFTWDAELRGGYFNQHRKERSGETTDSDDWRTRVRAGVGIRLDDAFSIRVRLAGRFSTEQDGARFLIRDHATGSDGLRLGEATIDEAYLNFRPSDRLNVRAGRMQTKFVLADLLAKSLDRGDSPNTEVSWTDGVHVAFTTGGGWRSHLVVQHNSSAGPTNVARPPLAFTDSRSRVTLFGALESSSANGLIAQRSLDFTYIPGALRDDTEEGSREDYLAFVGRGTLALPVISDEGRLLLGGELGYAPNTPSHRATGLESADDGDEVGGMAFQIGLTLSDALPGHRFGVVYGKADAGWLISPDFRNNDRLIEGRYQWSFARNHSFEARLRQRRELERAVNAGQHREDLDFFFRISSRF